MLPNSEDANIEQQITVSGWQAEDAPICISSATDAACCSCGATIFSNPDPVFSVSTACEDLPTFFLDKTNSSDIIAWQWDFGDGIGTSFIQNPFYIYPNPGDYTAVLTVTYADGEQRSVSNLVSICAGPMINPSEPSFAANSVCLGDLTLFSNTTTSTDVQSWFWDFGDGIGTSNLLNPTYTYVSEGIYDVTLVATFTDNSQQSITQEVIVYPMIWPLIRIENDSICIGDCVLSLIHI